MAHSDHFLPLYDAEGNLHAVLLSAELWTRGSKRLRPVVDSLLEAMAPVERTEPLEEWEAFRQWWDFRYPYNAEVECRHCGAKTADWQSDPAKPFALRSAQLGGLAVFHCNACGARVRKKHFKDHMCYEADAPKQE